MSTEKRRPLTPSERGRLAGLASWDALTPDQRERRVQKAGEAAREKLGKSHYVRMNYIRWQRLPSGSTRSKGVARPVNSEPGGDPITAQATEAGR